MSHVVYPPVARDRKDNQDGEYCQDGKKPIFGCHPNLKKIVTKSKDGKILSNSSFISFGIFKIQSLI